MCPVLPQQFLLFCVGHFFSNGPVFFLSVEQESSQIPPAEAGPSWGGQVELSSKPASLQARQLKGQSLSSFVFLFPLSLVCLALWSQLNGGKCTRQCLHTPVLSVGKPPPLSHDGSQISSVCRGREGG